MEWIEIALLVFGVAMLLVSFIMPSRDNGADAGQQIDDELIRSIIEKEMEDAKERVTEVVDETLEYAVEKTERASERISNEKIMAISEYSETVLADINKSHQEVMFLYDMLNDKHDNLKETVKHVDKTAKEAEEAANAAALALAAKAREEAELRAREKLEIQEARKDELERAAAVERAALEKEAREKEYARRQMARLILPVQQEMPMHRIGELREIPLNQDAGMNAQTFASNEQELRPLIVKSVEIVSADIVNSSDMQPVSGNVNAASGNTAGNTVSNTVSIADLQAFGSRPEDMRVLDAKPADIRPVEVYSFVDQAPHIERPVKKESQASSFENTLNHMRRNERQTVEEAKENNNDKILRLHREGISSVDIAKELGLGVGEVKLVINLFKGAV